MQLYSSGSLSSYWFWAQETDAFSMKEEQKQWTLPAEGYLVNGWNDVMSSHQLWDKCNTASLITRLPDFIGVEFNVHVVQ